jgi:hypothetical protein
MDENQYKVVRQLDDVMPEAATAHKAGVSFDVRLYFREDETGYQWAEVAFLDRGNAHHINDQMPLVGEGVVGWFFDQISQRGFPLARERRTGQGARPGRPAGPPAPAKRRAAAANGRAHGRRGRRQPPQASPGACPPGPGDQAPDAPRPREDESWRNPGGARRRDRDLAADPTYPRVDRTSSTRRWRSASSSTT